MEEKTPLTADELEKANTAVAELFRQLEISGDFELSEQDGTLDIQLNTEDTGIVIGYHGEILESLQLVTSLVVSRAIGKFARVSIEVGDYKKNRSSYLEKLAQQAKERVLDENREQELTNLKSWERRIVHMYLQDDKEVVSESVGEGRDRRLIVRPR
jgi:spoIIIJ-associated protein